MIYLGLTKILLVGVVALIVLGPEKLPKVARMAGSLWGRAQRYIAQVKSEVNREMELESLRQVKTDLDQVAQGVDTAVTENISLFSEMQKRKEIIYSAQELQQQAQKKSKQFKKRRLARIGRGYQIQGNVKGYILSGAARVARHRPQRAYFSFFR